MVDSITGSSATTATSAASKASQTLASNFDTFLTLLTTQLKNQDPLSPMDSAEFTQQLVQFAGVEQSIAANKNLEQLISLNQSSFAASLVNYIGRTVEANGETTVLEDGQATWTYELPANADKVTLSVTNENGQIVWTGDGEKSMGAHSFVWNGVGSGGTTQPEGFYKLKVTATDSAGNALKATTVIRGVVTGVDGINGVTVLNIGGVTVPLGNVLSVHATDTQNAI